VNREPIIQALADKLSAVSGVVTFDRILRHVSQVQPGECPAVFLAPRGQSAMRVRGLPAQWTIDVSVYVYTARTSDFIVPDTEMNGILDGIEAALEPAGGVEVQTLGGLVQHCWIEGAIETDEGTLGSQAVAIVPIRILVTP
jgi:hypothetical protein